MFPEQLKKILNLVKNTGDRVIIFDSNTPDDSYVIMGFDNYAANVNSVSANINKNAVPVSTPIMADLSVKSEEKENLTEEDLTDKINREISMWKNRENSVFLGEENKPKKAWQIPSKVKDKAQEIE
jgi:hypothetical protein